MAIIILGFRSLLLDKALSQELKHIIITSRVLRQAKMIPAAYTCSGGDVSPQLAWSGLPSGTQSSVLLMQDPDAPSGIFSHWIAYNLPNNLTALSEDASRQSESLRHRQGMNDFGKASYNGPCPPPGKVHHYHFQLFALDRTLSFNSLPRAADVMEAMRGHIMAQGDFIAVYSR